MKPPRLRLILVATAGLAVLVALLLAGVGRQQRDQPAADPGRAGEPAPSPTAPDPVEAFLTDYVAADGRVVRWDQGEDTVSEGQAYAMLLAVARGDQATFDRVWGWTRGRLLRPDGLLSWRYDGRVVDANSAADADLDAAHALVAAGTAFGRADLRADGVRLGRAVLDHETAPTPLGRMLLAGSWATGPPDLVNPSYYSPVAVTALATAVPDPRWSELADGYGRLLAGLRSTPLPPDWAQVTTAGKVEAMPPPAGGAVAFGLDAARVPVRAAVSCRTGDRDEAGRLADVLARSNDQVRGRYDLGGAGTVGWQHPLAFVAAAAAASAAGDETAADRLMAGAVELNRRSPTYYGAAWTALGSVWLDRRPDPLSPCPDGATE